MCYKRPGPRCSDHTYQELQAAKKAYNAAPSRTNLEALRRAKQEYAKTPRGIAAIERKAQATDDLLQKRRYVEIATDLREHRGAALAKLKELHPEEFTSGKVSAADRQLMEQWQREQDALAASSPDYRRQREVGKRYTAEEALRLASDAGTPPEQLADLCFHPEREVRFKMVYRDDCPAEGLRFLARDRSAGIRQKVAWHKNTEGDVINSMADDPDEGVLGGVANSSFVTRQNASKLSRHESSYVRGWAMANPITPQGDVARGVNDPEPSVREAVADNPLAAEPVLEHLSRDTSERVSLKAKEQLAMRHANYAALIDDDDDEWSVDIGSEERWDSLSLSTRL